MKLLFSLLLILLFCGTHAEIIYVNNVTGNDKNNGSKSAPVAGISRALKLVKKSGIIDVANTGKVYQSPYPGPGGSLLHVNTGGTPEKPLEIRGNGAVITGLAVIPASKWRFDEKKGVYTLPFWPMSNLYKRMPDSTHNFWPDTSAKIWWLNGKAAPNCKSLATLKKTPGAFWWNKAEKQVCFNLPKGEKIADQKIELPANAGFYITAPYVLIRDFYYIFSWNDGFDSAGLEYDGTYRNCVAVNNCGQGFSCHATGSTLYEDCAAIGCNSSGSCDVDQSFSRYMRCIFLNNTFEGGIHTNYNSQHYYGSCIIAGNIPDEQLWLTRSSSQHYFNCLIEGTPGKDIVSFRTHSGTISFRNCTIKGGKSFFKLLKNGSSSAAFQSCIIGGSEDDLFTAEQGTQSRLQNWDNVYFNIPGLIFRGRRYTKKEFATYKKANPQDRNSLWLDKEPASPCVVNKKTAGANLPESVLKRYEKLKRLRATAAGIYFEKQ